MPAGDYVIAPGPIYEFAMLGTSDVELVNPMHRVFGPLPATPALGKETHPSSGGFVRATGLESPVAAIGRNQFTPEVLDRNQTNYARVSVNVSDHDVAGIVVPFERLATLRCSVSFEDVTGPLPQGALQLYPANGSPSLTSASVLHQGDEWRSAFDIKSVLPGEYTLYFQPIGRGTPVTLKAIVVDGQDVSRKTVTAANGALSNVRDHAHWPDDPFGRYGA